MAGAAILSIQLYTLRALGDVGRVLDTVAAAGYRHVEAVGSYLDHADSFRAQLDARGLAAPTSHVGIAALRENLNATIAACKRIGITQLFMPSVPTDQRDSDAGYWTALGRELGELSHRLGDHGIALGYHNHNWELKSKKGNHTALDLLFAGADGSRLNWQADIAWLVRGGADPKILLQRYQPLVVSAHVKDIAPQGQNLDQDGWADVGAGLLDWHDLWRACRDAGASWMVVEHDKPADPASSVRNSFAFLKGMA